MNVMDPKCSTCGKLVEPSWTVCPFCRAKLPQRTFCSNCGGILEEGWRSCPRCGKAVEKGNSPSISLNDSVVREVHQTEQSEIHEFHGTKIDNVYINQGSRAKLLLWAIVACAIVVAGIGIGMAMLRPSQKSPSTASGSSGRAPVAYNAGSSQMQTLSPTQAAAPANPFVSSSRPPTASAGPDLSVDENQSVVLQGSGSDPDGGVLTFRWTTSTGSLSSPDVAQPVFYAPSVSQDTTVICTLTVTDSNGLSASDQVNVLVRPVQSSVTTLAPTNSSASAPIITIASDVPGTVLNIGSSISSVVDKQTKPRDVYAVSLTAGHEFRFSLSNTDLIWYLAYPGPGSFAANSMSLVSSAGGLGVSSFTFTPAVSGTYYIAIIAETSGQTYTVSVITTGY